MEHETIEYKGYKIKIMPDEYSENPFDYQDGMGRISFHPKSDYICSDEPDYMTAMEHKFAVTLDAYIHGGIVLSVAGEGYQCRWDTSTSIAIWTPDDCLEVKTWADAVKYAKQACELYNQWANGSVYYYLIETDAGERFSCGGFYGYDHNESGLLESAQEDIDCYIKEVKQGLAQFHALA